MNRESEKKSHGADLNRSNKNVDKLLKANGFLMFRIAFIAIVLSTIQRYVDKLTTTFLSNIISLPKGIEKTIFSSFAFLFPLDSNITIICRHLC